MGIDRIGKGGGVEAPVVPTPAVGPAGKSGGAARPAEAGAPFQVETKKPEAPAPVEAGKVSPLERFRSGEVDINGYLDLKVEDATSQLAGLSANELTAVRKMLRDQLASDPALSDLVQHATGRLPTTPEE
jgi:hypothetical protein